jgi:phospholipid transport system substrate-binding protein
MKNRLKNVMFNATVELTLLASIWILFQALPLLAADNQPTTPSPLLGKPSELSSSVATQSASLENKTVKSAPELFAKNWPADSPIGVIENYQTEIRSLIRKYDNKKGAAQIAERDRVLGQRVRKFFDFEELARLSISNHWSKLTKAQQQRFVSTFTKLVERSYLNKTREMIADYAVTYDNQDVKADSAKVSSIIKKKDLDVNVVYEMKHPSSKSGAKKEHSWVIYNVIFDNLDLLGNYKSQFNRIITQKSFAELLRIMEDRLKNPAETV